LHDREAEASNNNIEEGEVNGNENEGNIGDDADERGFD